MSTIVSILIFGHRVLDHLLRSYSCLRYSIVHRYQKFWDTCITLLNLVSLFKRVSISFRSGNARRESPIRNCPGVSNDYSDGSDEIGVIGREINTALMSTRRVVNSSNVRETLTRKLYKCDLRDKSRLRLHITDHCKRIEEE